MILVTGATGFVGRQVVRALAEKGAKLRAVVRPCRIGSLSAEGGAITEVVTTDDLFSENDERLREICEGIDTIVHLAWYAEPGKYLQSGRNMDCLAGTLALARAAVATGVRRFVGTGTCFEYDVDACVLSVDTPLKPATPYAAAKAAAYLALSRWLPVQGVEFAWCRLFYLYGEGEDERRLVAYIRSRLSRGEVAELTSGNQIRDFLDVREAGRRIAGVALGERQGAVNICSGVPVTVRQLAERIADEYGRRDLLAFGARPENVMDPPCVVGKRNDSEG